jgi:hypothetical protein
MPKTILQVHQSFTNSLELKKNQGQRKAWRIPSPKKLDPVTLTFDLENHWVPDSLKV